MYSVEPVNEVTPLPQERRRFRRVRLSVLGRYMLEDRREFPCQTIDISPGGVGLIAPVLGAIASRVIVYLEHLGRIEGMVVRELENGFAMTIAAPQRKQDKLAAQITWLVNRQAFGLPEDRRHERIELANMNSIISFRDGRRLQAIIVDCSISGAALDCGEMVPLGTDVTIGHREARVVRHFEGGIAVEFVQPISGERFNRDFEL
ncbi:MAG: PilZ domain-containing protein [Hyphomicrobiales bacterium]|nr:PilZ domain-containing protein [Hyphomicrobiales bacterium]MBV8767989.1 PilZ domain-containing protein [Hyphomicrobiales bacterium]MBV9051162.1 PilZ domain-containing protein [Hyphomicrobiales bacterium]MBV9975639.1 PilZ domain-containing protein [Hyphomicrobiales bacterium]